MDNKNLLNYTTFYMNKYFKEMSNKLQEKCFKQIITATTNSI